MATSKSREQDVTIQAWQSIASGVRNEHVIDIIRAGSDGPYDSVALWLYGCILANTGNGLSYTWEPGGADLGAGGYTVDDHLRYLAKSEKLTQDDWAPVGWHADINVTEAVGQTNIAITTATQAFVKDTVIVFDPANVDSTTGEFKEAADTATQTTIRLDLKTGLTNQQNDAVDLARLSDVVISISPLPHLFGRLIVENKHASATGYYEVKLTGVAGSEVT